MFVRLIQLLVSSFDSKSVNGELPKQRSWFTLFSCLLSTQEAQIFTGIQTIPIKIHNEVLSLTDRMMLQPFLLLQNGRGFGFSGTKHG